MVADRDILDDAGRSELDAGMRTRLGSVLSEAIEVHSMIQMGITVTPGDITDEGLIALQVLTEEIDRVKSRRAMHQALPTQPSSF